MKELKVKTIWQGCATMRDKYWSEIKEGSHDVKFIYAGDEPRYLNQTMTIPFNEINGRVYRRAKMKVADRYSNAEHILLYFLWKPDNVVEQSPYKAEVVQQRKIDEVQKKLI